MDFQQLFNQNFGENELNILEKLINLVYTTYNQNERDQANKILQQFQENPQSVLKANFILDKTKEIKVAFFALQILENFCSKNWDSAPLEFKQQLRQYLTNKLQMYVNDDNFFSNPQNKFFINKLNTVLVLIAKNEWTSTCPNIISEFCQAATSSPNSCINSIKILIMLSEKINKFWENDTTLKEAKILKDKMSNEFIKVFEFCIFIFNSSSKVTSEILREAVKLFSEYTVWFSLDNALNPNVAALFLGFLQNSDCKSQVLEAFAKIFEIDIDSKFLGDMNVNLDPRNNRREILDAVYANEKYRNYRNFEFQVYQKMIDVMYNQVTKKNNLFDKYNYFFSKEPSRLDGYEKLISNFEQSIFNFFKSNFSFLATFNFIDGTKGTPTFLRDYKEQIELGLDYMLQLLKIDQPNIFKMALEFWNFIVLKIYYIKDPYFDVDFLIGNNNNDNNILQNNYLNFACDSYLYKQVFNYKLNSLREIIINKMVKPIEVKISIDDSGEVVFDPNINTEYEVVHNMMRETLIILTHFDADSTQELLTDKVRHEVECYRNLDPVLLNSVSWSAGCISGAMKRNQEVEFLVTFIKELLTLCEKVSGNGRKAVCASNVMYVVGQYPDFLNEHWRFLKTVVKKLFEFMHETFQGVKDFSLETFLKIAMKCGNNFIIKQYEETEPYVNELIRKTDSICQGLENYQKLMFFGAIAKIISNEKYLDQKIQYVEKLVSPLKNGFLQVKEQTKNNNMFILQKDVMQIIDIFVKTNEIICMELKDDCWKYVEPLLDDLINICCFYLKVISDAKQANQNPPCSINNINRIAKTLLKFFTSLVDNMSTERLDSCKLIPKLFTIIDFYANTPYVEAQNPYIISMSATISQKFNNRTDVSLSIWEKICRPTLNLIKKDLVNFPEHRKNFFILLKSLISNHFSALFDSLLMGGKLDEVVMIKDTLLWAIHHEASEIYENGLSTLYTFLYNASRGGMKNAQFLNDFFQNYFLQFVHDIIDVMTDTKHQGGFKSQVMILQVLVGIVDSGILRQNLFTTQMDNKSYIMVEMKNQLVNGFPGMSKNLIETFILALFNKYSDYTQFKQVVRDFIINSKKFSGNSEALWEEEKKKEIEESKKRMEQRKNLVPGFAPVYNAQMQSNLSSMAYENFAK